jgi:tRNA(Arg) A34 adenosine deaminase TadA
MAKALAQARRAFELDEVPIGAVVVVAGKIVGRGFNKSIRQSDPTARGDPCPAPGGKAFGKLPVDFSHALLRCWNPVPCALEP